jgi:hypothetical protein
MVAISFLLLTPAPKKLVKLFGFTNQIYSKKNIWNEKNL